MALGIKPHRSQPILVVEDDLPTREFIVDLLTGEKIPVATAADGAEARAWVAKTLPALVILDLVLPKISGFDLLAEWRAHPRTAELPALVLTSKDLSKAEESYLREHAGALLQKQTRWQETLLARVRRVTIPTAERAN
jgi:DNA-binding response OmpR family regulator